MTQITHCRRFNGSSDEIRLTSTDLVGAVGAQTFAVIAKNDETGGFQWMISLQGGTGGEWAYGKTATALQLYFEAVATAGSDASYWTAAMGWCLVAVTRADGTSTPRWHRYRYDTSSWDHTNDGGTLAEVAAPSGTPNLWLGTYDGASEFFDGDMAVAAVWNSTALSDGQLEALTGSISAWESAAPTCLWLLDQADVGTSVTDRVGNADQAAITGTTAVAISDLAFDVGGGVSSNTSKGMTLLGVG